MMTEFQKVMDILSTRCRTLFVFFAAILIVTKGSKERTVRESAWNFESTGRAELMRESISLRNEKLNG